MPTARAGGHKSGKEPAAPPPPAAQAKRSRHTGTHRDGACPSPAAETRQKPSVATKLRTAAAPRGQRGESWGREAGPEGAGGADDGNGRSIGDMDIKTLHRSEGGTKDLHVALGELFPNFKKSSRRGNSSYRRSSEAISRGGRNLGKYFASEHFLFQQGHLFLLGGEGVAAHPKSMTLGNKHGCQAHTMKGTGLKHPRQHTVYTPPT